MDNLVVITGNDWSLRDKDPNEYVAGIVYGSPEVTVVRTAGHFVALCDFGEAAAQAEHTFLRMGSFSYGASLFVDRLIALREFGTWVYHYSETKSPLSA
jgi:hypothetical protein